MSAYRMKGTQPFEDVEVPPKVPLGKRLSVFWENVSNGNKAFVFFMSSAPLAFPVAMVADSHLSDATKFGFIAPIVMLSLCFFAKTLSILLRI